MSNKNNKTVLLYRPAAAGAPGQTRGDYQGAGLLQDQYDTFRNCDVTFWDEKYICFTTIQDGKASRITSNLKFTFMEDAMMVAGWLNDRSLKQPADAYVPHYYRAEADNYKLQKFEP